MPPTSYPDIIKALPLIKTDLEGVTGWLAQGKSFQIVFFKVKTGCTIPPHSHGAQFGFVIHGSLILTIGDTSHDLKTGDSYYIPDKVTHHGTFTSDTLVMDFFAEPNRYQTE